MRVTRSFVKRWATEFENVPKRGECGCPINPIVIHEKDDISVDLERMVGRHVKLSLDECRVLHGFLDDFLKRV